MAFGVLGVLLGLSAAPDTKGDPTGGVKSAGRNSGPSDRDTAHIIMFKWLPILLHVLGHSLASGEGARPQQPDLREDVGPRPPLLHRGELIGRRKMVFRADVCGELLRGRGG